MWGATLRAEDSVSGSTSEVVMRIGFSGVIGDGKEEGNIDSSSLGYYPG